VRFGEKIRSLRVAKGLSQRRLVQRVGMSFAYVSKIESAELDFGDYPSEEMVRRLVTALDADGEELLLPAEKIPEAIRRRVFERPDASRLLARLDDQCLDRLPAAIAGD
jgi:transcriptional regulator with XRE-family HTH domain